MTLPTTPAGFRGAVAWAAATAVVTWFDDGYYGRRPVVDHDAVTAARAERPTAQSALDAVCARARAQQVEAVAA
jgi:hypothetical protein